MRRIVAGLLLFAGCAAPAQERGLSSMPQRRIEIRATPTPAVSDAPELRAVPLAQEQRHEQRREEGTAPMLVAQPCVRLPTDVPNSAMERIPPYTREMWLADSLATADVVVVGAIEGTPPSIRVDRVLCGAVHASLETRGTLRALPMRLTAGDRGVFLLVRTPVGYLSVNPDAHGLPMDEWQAIVARGSPAPEAPELVEHSLAFHQGTELSRTERVSRARHGVEVRVTGGVVFVQLFVQDVSIALRGFDGQGLLVASRLPVRGPGFRLEDARFGIGERNGVRMWRYAHYRDRVLEGTSRVFVRGNGAGDAATGGFVHGGDRLARETHYRRGLPNGRGREWSADGRLEHDAVYLDGLVVPVVEPTTGPRDGARLTIDADMATASYSAPRALVDRIRVGMTGEEVARLLGLRISLTTGLAFNYPDDCGWDDIRVRFSGRRVASVDVQRTSGPCEPPW